VSAFEVNFDGLVGPSHHYAGLSQGNIASKKNAMTAANPKAAALQGLKKMQALSNLGCIQGVLAPHLRPNLEILRALGFTGSDKIVLDKAWRDAPEIVSKCYSASPMWTANAATISPAMDTADGRMHITAANLCRMFHRSYESEFTEKLLARMFSDEQYFCHHQPLPSGHFFGDEGAANHTRLADQHGANGLELFVYGETAFNSDAPKPKRYPARQSFEASQAIARLHGLDSDNTVFAQQNPQVIDAGVFHNDVIAVGTTSLLFYHQQAFLDSDQVINEIQSKYTGDCFYPLEVKDDEISVATAVNTYLFNTQLIDRSTPGSNKEFLLIAPTECEENKTVAQYLEKVVRSKAPITEVKYFDLRESMKNGGGPACLRLRIILNQAQLNSIKPNVFMNDDLYENLKDWVENHYRDRLSFEDLRDPQLFDELQDAAQALEPILNLEGIYGL